MNYSIDCYAAQRAVARLADVIRRKHLALATEQSCCAWLRRYCQHIAMPPVDMPSEQKLEHLLTALSETNITASTQNQAFNADAMSVASLLDA